MSKKFSAARKRAFFQYLAETGNVTLACERAKVSRSWALLHRKGDAEFAAAWEGALDQAKGRLLREARERLSAPPLPPPLCGSSLSRGGERGNFFAGHELVVSGTNGVRTQVRRARLGQWTPRVERRFLSALAATCNVKAACAEAGMSVGSAYAHRHRGVEFARAWDEAIEIGYVRLEAGLVEAGCRLLSLADEAGPLEEPEYAPDIGITELTAWQAIHLLHMHKHQVRGIGKRPGGEERLATDEEVEKALEKSLRRVLAQRKLAGEREGKSK